MEQQYNNPNNQPQQTIFNQFSNQPYQYQASLPNATGSLVLGILSIVSCFIGLILGIIGLVLANKDRKVYDANPQMYTLSSLKNTNAGRICSIIGIILNTLIIIIYAVIIIVAINNNAFEHNNHYYRRY